MSEFLADLIGMLAGAVILAVIFAAAYVAIVIGDEQRARQRKDDSQ